MFETLQILAEGVGVLADQYPIRLAAFFATVAGLAYIVLASVDRADRNADLRDERERAALRQSALRHYAESERQMPFIVWRGR